MQLTAFIATASLLATSVVATPYPHVDGKAIKRASPRSSLKPSNAVGGGAKDGSVNYNPNWAGIVLEAPAGKTFSAVSMQFRVPDYNVPKDGTESWYINGARAAIDGYYTEKAPAAILNTGIDWNTDTTGFKAAYPFTGWNPQNNKDYSPNVEVKTNDLVEISVVAYNSTSGITFLKNLSTNNSSSATLSALPGAGGLVGQNVQWAIDAYHYDNGTAMPMCDFGTIKFTKAHWTTTDGVSGGLGGGQILDVKQDKTYTQTTLVNDDEFDVTYIG